jgi:putative secretion ATPase (PEP-CTERM system associated)
MKKGDYEQFFNLSAKPFDLVPNPEFLYLSKTHRKAMTYLEYGIREKAGFILLTGEVGSGKTTLIRNLIKQLDGQVVLSKVFNTKVNSDQLVAMINDDFGLEVDGKDKTALLRDLYAFLIDSFSKGLHPVLIIDEAQNLNWELLEEVRMLSNLETDSSKLLQIILVGQPELKQVLAKPELRQFRQRINISCHLYHLMREETEEYIQHRLVVAGGRDAVTFSKQAIDIIFQYSRGVPRLINIICDFLMLAAFIEKTREISDSMARDIVKDLEFENQYWDFEGPRAVQDGAPAEQAEAPAPARKDHRVLHEMRDMLKDLAGRVEALERKSSVPFKIRDLIKELSGKVEALEKSSSVTKIAVPKEIGKRLELLEKVLEEHFEKNHAVPEKIDNRPEPYDTMIKYASKAETDKNVKRSFLQRIFG